MLGCDCCSVSSIVYVVGLFTIASKVVPFVLKKIKGDKPVDLQEKNFKKDVVYLYQFPGTPTASSMSPFCMKIEAFLRLYKIEFKRCNTTSVSGQNGQKPFIELNGEHIADSQTIIRRLTQKFNLKIYPDAQTAAIGHAVDRLLDNHTFNLLCLVKQGVAHKVVEVILRANSLPSFLVSPLSSLGGYLFAKMTVERASTSIGKFSEKDYNELFRNDLVQLQTILGKKKYLMGDEPTAVDCTALGQFAFGYLVVPSARYYFHDLLESSEFAPLKEYIERVKTRIFGDEFHDN